MTRGYTSRLAISGALRFQVRKHQVTRYCPMFFQLCDLWFHDHLPVWTLMTNSKIDWYIPDHACVFLSLYCTTIFAKLHSCPIPIPVGSVCICCWLYIYILEIQISSVEFIIPAAWNPSLSFQTPKSFYLQGGAHQLDMLVCKPI
jgi:hypothetical protein